MLIGLHGSGRCGKDTAHRLLAEIATNRVVLRDAFADRLKDSAAEALGIDRAVLESIKDSGRIVVEKPGGPGVGWMMILGVGVRRYMERYGTEAHRDIFGQDFWVKAVMERHDANLAEDPKTLTTITDLRFANEAEAVRERGGQVWHVIRPGASLVSDHPSNAALPSSLIDQTIVNDAGMAEYRDKLAKAWKEYSRWL